MKKLTETTDQKLNNVFQMANHVLRNQVELAKSTESLDEQFAVLTRMVVMKVNELVTKHNDFVKRTTGDNQTTFDMYAAHPISYDSINLMFMAFAEYKKRSDYKDHAHIWYGGADLSTLPPPPGPPKPEETVVGDPPADPSQQAPQSLDDSVLAQAAESGDVDVPDGAQVWGGDFSGADGEKGGEEDVCENWNGLEAPPTKCGEDQEVELPLVPSRDSYGDRSEDAETGPEVQPL